MKKFLLGVLASACLFACNADKKGEIKTTATKSATADDTKKPAAELLDPAMGEDIKNVYKSLAKGDIDGMTANYDENILFTWSSGDSLVGKQAVTDYWKNRWSIIESLEFTNQVVLPIQVNEKQAPTQRTGKYALYWGLTNAKYKNGKTVQFMSHSVNHYNDAGKIDYVRMYYDRLPITEATRDLVGK